MKEIIPMAVGSGILKSLEKKRARVIAVSDLNEKNIAVFNPVGLEFKEIFRSLKETGTVANYRLSHQEIPLGEEIFLEADFIWYGAKSDVITHLEQVERLKAPFHIEVANLPISTECQRALVKKGCYIVLDIAANIGGVLSAYIEHTFMDELSVEEKIAMAFREVAYSARTVTRKITERVLQTKRAPREVALEIIKERIHQAQKGR